MAAINVRCPNCAQTLRVTYRVLGVRVRCKFCQQPILIEAQQNPPAHNPALETMDLPPEDNVFEQQTIGPAQHPVAPAPGWTGSPGVFEQQTIGPAPPPVAPPSAHPGNPGVYEQQTIGPAPPPWAAPPPPAGASPPGVFEQQTVTGSPAAPARAVGVTTLICPACHAAHTVPARDAGLPFQCRCGTQLSASFHPPGPPGSGGWYYERNGAPAGPVGERDLRYLADNDILQADDRVWTAGMPAWQTAAAVLPRFFPEAAAGPGWPFLRVLALILSTVATASVVLLVVVIARGRPVAVAKADPVPPADTPAPVPAPAPVPKVTPQEMEKENKNPVVVEPRKKSPPIDTPVPKTPVTIEPVAKAPDPPVIMPMPKPRDPVPMGPPVVVQKRPPSAFPPPPHSWESKWVSSGDVQIRVAGLALREVLLETRKKRHLSNRKYFVVWVEVENTSKKDLTYDRWQPVTTGECTLRYKDGGTVPYATYNPPEASRVWFTEFRQPLPAGGPPLLEPLVFEPPDTRNAGPLTLTLDTTRAGGALRRVELVIPHAEWAQLKARAPDDRPDAVRTAVTLVPTTPPGRSSGDPLPSRPDDRLATSAGAAGLVTRPAGRGGSP